MSGADMKARKRSDGAGSNRGIVVAAVFLVVVLVAGLISLFLGRSSSDSTAAEAIESTMSGDGMAAASCPNSGDAPIAVPDGGPVDWEIITVGNGLIIPQSPEYGPAVTTGIPHCFNKGTAGALFAAANFTTWYLSNQDILNAFDTLAWPDIVRSEWEAEIVDKCGANLAGCPTNEVPSLVAYSGRQFSEDRVNVSLVFDTAPGSGYWTAMQVPLRWNGQDWLVMLPAAGPVPTTSVSSLDSYTPWRLT